MLCLGTGFVLVIHYLLFPKSDNSQQLPDSPQSDLDAMIQKLDEVKQEAEAMKAKGDLAKGVQELQEAAKVSKEKIAVILREQQNLNRKNFWKEWGISLGLGVMSSIIATYIWVNYLG